MSLVCLTSTGGAAVATSVPNPSSARQLADLEANPQNYVDSTVSIPLTDTDFDVYTNNYNTPIVMTASGSPALIKAAAPASSQPVGFNILYTPCGKGSATININNQCTGNGCVIPSHQTRLTSCGGANGSHGNVQYVLTTPNAVLAKGLYSVSPNYLITFQAGL